MWGSDQAASLEPPGFKHMVRDIRAVELALGTGNKTILAEEVPIAAKLRRVSA
jgi:N-acetylneuraminate synthase